MPWDCSVDFGIQWQKAEALLEPQANGQIAIRDDELNEAGGIVERPNDRLVKCKFLLFIDLGFKIKAFKLKALVKIAYKGKLLVRVGGEDLSDNGDRVNVGSPSDSVQAVQDNMSESWANWI